MQLEQFEAAQLYSLRSTMAILVEYSLLCNGRVRARYFRDGLVLAES